MGFLNKLSKVLGLDSENEIPQIEQKDESYELDGSIVLELAKMKQRIIAMEIHYPEKADEIKQKIQELESYIENSVEMDLETQTRINELYEEIRRDFSQFSKVSEEKFLLSEVKIIYKELSKIFCGEENSEQKIDITYINELDNKLNVLDGRKKEFNGLKQQQYIQALINTKYRLRCCKMMSGNSRINEFFNAPEVEKIFYANILAEDIKNMGDMIRRIKFKYNVRDLKITLEEQEKNIDKIINQLGNAYTEEQQRLITDVFDNDEIMRLYVETMKVLRDKITFLDRDTEKLKQEIVSELIERGYQNKSIDYAEFLKLYEPYRIKVKESEFASILGISYKNWQTIKHKGNKSTINFEHKYSSRILYLFGENKEYDLKYFEEVSKNLGLPIYKILEILTKERTNLEELINALHTRGKIFVGQTRISDSFLQKYGEIISDDIHKYSKQIGKKLHTGMYAEDFAQEAILWVIGKKGNIERNFEEGLALERIIKYAKINCKYMHFKIFSQKKVVSLDEGLSENGKITRLKRVKSKDNVQDSVEKREEIEISEDDTPIILIQRCISNGMNREEALSFVMKKFNISKKELLETLTEELSKRNKIKVAETGEVYLGARDE